MNLQILLTWLHGLFIRHDLATPEVNGAFATLDNASKSLFGKLGHALHLDVRAGSVTHTPTSIPSPGQGATMVGHPVTESPEPEVAAAAPSDKIEPSHIDLAAQPNVIHISEASGPSETVQTEQPHNPS